MDEMFLLLWRRYRTWAETARQLNEKNTMWKRYVLTLTIGGTALATLGPHASTGLTRVLPVAGAAGLAVATYFGKELLDAKHQESWTRARAAAETFKSEACKYLVQVPPYDGPDRAARLKARMDELSQVTKDQTPVDITQGLAAKGAPREVWTIKDYLASRVDDQVGWYRLKARKHSASMRRGRAISLTLGCVSVLLGVATGTTTESATLSAAVLGLVTTAGGSIGAYFQAGHYEGIALKYRETADALETLKAEFNSPSATQGPADFVSAIERIVQAENAAWLTERTSRT